MQEIALYGGSFNPVHFGHLIAAQSVLDTYNFDKLVFIPNGFNPFKKNLDKTTRKACLDMLKIATKDNPKFDVESYEIDNEGVKYTYYTIEELKRRNPEAHYTFIVGSDILHDLEKWHRFKELIQMVDFIVVGRAGYDEEFEIIEKLNDKYQTNIKFHKIPEVEISSTDIRNKKELGKSVKYLTPDSIVDYIQDKELYKLSEEYEKYINNIQVDLKNKLKPNRYNHSINVMNTAIELAERFGVDIIKAQIAGLTHDCAKYLKKNEMTEYIKENNLDIPKEFFENPATLHAPLGAALAREVYGIKDKEILDAIAKHTTGGAQMNKLDKIIYLADYIEPSRTQPGVDEVREIAQYDLDRAVMEALNKSIDYLTESGMIINPTSLQARDNLKKEIKNGRK